MMELEIQGHRGARGLAPENTLAGFDVAIAAGATSLEVDVHLTGDDVPVLVHDPAIAGQRVRSLTLAQLQSHRVAGPTCIAPRAEQFAAALGIDARGIPTLAEFLAFVAGFEVIADIELKRVPFEPETIGDGFKGDEPGLLEEIVVQAIRDADVLERARVRSFDHRCVRAVKQLEPALATGLLIHNTLPVDVVQLLAQVDADIYCPDYRFLDAKTVRQASAAGKRVIPYTVNNPSTWERLVGWGVHGITTDFPDRLKEWQK